MASLASAARDIPKASLSRDNLTVVAARSVPGTVTRTQILPTPPNSLSPALPPMHGLKAALEKAQLEPIDSDLELQDDQDSGGSSPGLDSAGAITPALLAKYHLPGILLNHGPLAIRHIMGYLTTSVPGFSGIPPTKARRLVVGALEGRVGEEGVVNGDVEFEKVGWGRWDAKRKGQPSRERQPSPPSGASSYGNGIPISLTSGLRVDRARLHAAEVASSHNGSAVFSHDDREMMMHNLSEHEADKMSLDDSTSPSCSEAPDDDEMDDDSDDATDDEDWAAIGAAALRAESVSKSAAGRHASSPLSPFVYTGGSGMRMQRTTSNVMARSHQPQTNLDFAAFGRTADAQEREAVEALLRLGSV